MIRFSTVILTGMVMMSIPCTAFNSETINPTVPVVDMRLYYEEGEVGKKEFAALFGRALVEVGCVGVVNTRLPSRLTEQILTETKAYFALPDNVKMEGFTGDGLHGFVPFGQEHAKDHAAGDLKEFYHTTGVTQPSHLWPTGHLPSFQPAVDQLYSSCDECVKDLLVAIAIYLGFEGEHERNLLANLLGDGNNIFRLLHYPPLDRQTVPSDAWRAAAHEDINLITIIPLATHRGLQVKTKGGEWLDVVVPLGAVIVTPSEIMGHMTNQKIPATRHRVVNQLDTPASRYSFPFFASPAPDAMIECIGSCFDEAHGEVIPPPVVHSELLFKRLKAIGIK